MKTINAIMTDPDMTFEVAQALAASGWWQHIPAKEAVLLQLRQSRLCLPNYGELRKLLSKALSREVDGPEMNWISKETWIEELERLA